jgi:DNA-directed RNA polymerase specialized sigma24 family protein
MIKPKRRIVNGYFILACRKYEPLINSLSFSISVDATHAEELKARGKDELLKCMICYDGRSSFMTFLYSRLSGTFKHMRDVENRARRARSIPVGFSNNMIRFDGDTDLGVVVEECMKCLTDTERVVVHESFFGKRTIRDISIERNIPPSTVWKIRHDALDKMKRRNAGCLE